LEKIDRIISILVFLIDKYDFGFNYDLTKARAFKNISPDQLVKEISKLTDQLLIENELKDKHSKTDEWYLYVDAADMSKDEHLLALFKIANKKRIAINSQIVLLNSGSSELCCCKCQKIRNLYEYGLSEVELKREEFEEVQSERTNRLKEIGEQIDLVLFVQENYSKQSRVPLMDVLNAYKEVTDITIRQSDALLSSKK
jgi:hypothetical protein